MATVVGRVVYALAALLLVGSLLGLRATTRNVFHYPVTLPGGGPALVYEPGEPRSWRELPKADPPLPVVVLAHAFASNPTSMSTLARHLARAGYAVITPAFSGHGRNRRPFTYEFGGVASGLIEDLEAAVLYARTQPHLDGQHVALAGHSLGGHAVLAYAGRDPSVGAVIGISGGNYLEGPYSPPNLLLIWASGDPARGRAHFREVGAQLAGLQRLVLDRTYGDPARGSAVRLSEVEGVGHMSIIYSSETARRILAWLESTLGPGIEEAASPRSDGRFGWSALGLVAALVLAWGLVRLLAPLLPRGALPDIRAPITNLAALLAALLASVLLFAGIDALGTAGPFGIVPLVVGRDVIGLLALTGILLWVWLARRDGITSAALRDVRTYVGAGLLVGFGYIVIGTVMQPFLSFWPAPQRVLWCLVCSALCLPYFGATEWLLRGTGATGVWLPVLGKLLTLVVLFGGAVVGLLPVVILHGVAAIALGFLLLEVFAYRLSRVAPEPWVAAVYQAAWLGWALGAVFPLD